jgi:hypothetical protein
VDGFFAPSYKYPKAARRLKAALLAVDVLLNAGEPEWERVSALLAAVGAAAERQDPKSAAAIEYHYRRLQLAEQRHDAAAALAAAQAIVEHGAGTAYELPALAAAARAADEAVKNANPTERPQKLAAAASLYARIVSLLGEGPAVLAGNKNALAAASKLAQYDEEQEHWGPAAERWKKLVAAQPKDRRLLRRAGVACFRAGQFETALGYWRTLANGLTSGSDDWFEAKYYQLACLEKTDAKAAQSGLAQFRVLFPDVKSVAWRDKLAELAERLSEKNS